MSQPEIHKVSLTIPSSGLFPNNSVALEMRAREWLTANGKEPLMIYNNYDRASDRGHLVVVLSDRNTALMLKLAMN